MNSDSYCGSVGRYAAGVIRGDLGSWSVAVVEYLGGDPWECRQFFVGSGIEAVSVGDRDGGKSAVVDGGLSCFRCVPWSWCVTVLHV